MESKHTPGPWHSRKTVSGMFEILDANRDPVFRIRGGVTPTAHDARLIAAAPDLLEASEIARALIAQMLGTLRDQGITGAFCMPTKLTAAIAKATQ